MSRITNSEVRSLMEEYNAPQELTEEQVWEEVENWVNALIEEGYDLSDCTWEEMYESYIFNPFDVVIGHLLDQGYADTEESALAIMANMSEEWRESIVEGNAAIRANVPSGRTVKMTATGKEPPGDRFVRQAGETIGRFLGSRGVQKIEPAPPQRKPLVSTSKPGPSNNFGRGF
jgi:hypothetical protein